MKVLINNPKDILLTFESLDMSKDSTILVTNSTCDIIGGIFFNKEINKWVFYIDCFNMFELDNDDNLHTIHRKLLHYNSTEFIFTTLPDMDTLVYDIKQSIIASIINDLMQPTSNTKSIITKVKSDLFKPISIYDNYGILIGCSSTIEDYYYIVMKSNGNLCFHSCVGGYNILDENNIPDDLKKLMFNPNLKEMSITAKNKLKNEFEVVIV